MIKSIFSLGFILAVICFFLIYKNSGSVNFYNSELNSILQTIVYLYIGAAFAYTHSYSSAKKASLSSFCISLLLELLDTVSRIMKLNANAFGDSFDEVAHMTALKKLSNKVVIIFDTLNILKLDKEGEKLKKSFFDFKKATTKIDFNKTYNSHEINRYFDSVQLAHDNFLMTIDKIRFEVINK